MTPARAVGAVLVLTAYAPLHRLLDPARAGPAGQATRDSAETAWMSGLTGTAIVVGLAYAASRFLDGSGVRKSADKVFEALRTPASVPFALGASGLAGLLSGSVALWVHGRGPTSVDEMSQLLHAQAVLGGSLTVPTHGSGAAFVIQNGLLIEGGWASIYPPLHTLALATGLAAGGAWLVGPVAVATTTLLIALSFEHLLGRGLGRAAAIALAVSPFWLLLGSTHLSHSTAAAALAAVLYCAVRARTGGPGWAFATGAAIGAAVTTRPWVGLVTSAALVTSLWLPREVRSEKARWYYGSKLIALVIGGFPFALLLFWWNDALFGSPLTLGYSAAFGPAHGLGFHMDPWGNVYGPIEALAYTGADVLRLSIDLLPSPLPVVALIGAGLLLRPGLPAGRVFLIWAGAALAANALYWHHGLHFGPRMLFESTPAWTALLVTSAAWIGSREAARGFGAWVVLVAALGVAALTPGAISSAAQSGLEVPSGPVVPSETYGTVFVHGSWSSRIAGRLAEAGVRRDSIETALRRNDICTVDRYARWRHAPDPSGPAPFVDFDPGPGSPPALQARALSDGNLVRVDPSYRWDDACRRQATSDRLGVLELEPILWQMPPLFDGGFLLARDLGPALNARSRGRLPEPWQVLIADDRSGGVRVIDYDAGMELLWRGAAGR